MNTKQFLGAIAATLLKIAVAAAVIILVFRYAVKAYDFGYRVFADIPVSSGEGRTVSVVVSDDQDEKELSQLLEIKGLVQDADVFYIQEQLSEYKGKLKAGTYELSTAMTAQEMLEIMCGDTEETQQ